MPYIKRERRDQLKVTSWPLNPGELNYIITDICLSYFHEGHKNYQGINDILGALEGAKLEFYRRVVVPYEDRKIIENGDVY